MRDPAKTTTGEGARERVAGAVDDPVDSMHHAEDDLALEHRGFFRVWRGWLRRRIGR